MQPIDCPQCRKSPVSSKDKEMYVLHCPIHPYYIAQGYTEDEVIRHWNTFVSFMQKDKALKAMQLEGGLDESFCLICQINTISKKVIGVFDTLECLSCNFLKFSGNLEVTL